MVLAADHGEMGGAHGIYKKGEPYEEALRVPLGRYLSLARGQRSLRAMKQHSLHAGDHCSWLVAQETAGVACLRGLLSLPRCSHSVTWSQSSTPNVWALAAVCFWAVGPERLCG